MSEGAVTRVREDRAPAVFGLTNKDVGGAFDLTGWADFQLVISAEAQPLDPAAAELYRLPGAIDAEPTAGRLSFPVTAAAAAEPPGYRFYEIIANDPNGLRRTLSQGRWNVIQTRAAR